MKHCICASTLPKACTAIGLGQKRPPTHKRWTSHPSYQNCQAISIPGLEEQARQRSRVSKAGGGCNRNVALPEDNRTAGGWWMGGTHAFLSPLSLSLSLPQLFHSSGWAGGKSCGAVLSSQLHIQQAAQTSQDMLAACQVVRWERGLVFLADQPRTPAQCTTLQRFARTVIH